jgi:long-chain acyl-CoA synthetase
MLAPGGSGWLTFRDLERRLGLLPRLAKTDRAIGRWDQGPEVFLLQLLRAWRDGAVFTPLEGPPAPGGAEVGIPPGTVLIRRTSGSTGEPVSIALSAEALLADHDQLARALGLAPEFPSIGAISLAHAYGFSTLALPLLLSGVPMVASPGPLPATVGELARRHPDATLPAVPALWRAWQQAGVLRGARVRMAISAGAPLPLDTETDLFDQTGIKIHNLYGSSDCGGIAFDPARYRGMIQTMPAACCRVFGPASVNPAACGWPARQWALATCRRRPLARPRPHRLPAGCFNPRISPPSAAVI